MSPRRGQLQHVGINAIFLGPRMGGLETYVRRLLPALIEVRPDWRYTVFVNPQGNDHLATEPWADRVELVSHPLLGRRYTRALTELTVLGWLAGRRQLDLLHSVALIAPLRMSAVNVLTIADVIWLHQPDPAERATARLWSLLVPLSARRADRVIALSRDSRDEIARDLRVPKSKIDVVSLGPGVMEIPDPTPQTELRSRLDLGSGPVILSVSAMKVHKNLIRLVEAIASVREAFPTAKLVIPGNPTPHQAELERLAAGLGIADAVCFPGWVDERDLEGLYRCASCFVFPSLREGFGLPVLEAMRRGVPVACSNVSALPEVAGKAARYFDPTDTAEISAALVELLRDRDLADRLIQAGLDRQRLFTWRATAEATIETYERAAFDESSRRAA